MEVKKYFLSSNNLNSLSKKLYDKLELDNDDALEGCKDLLKSQMKYTFEQNKNILTKGPVQKVVKYLNDKSIGLCEKIYNEKINKMKKSRELGVYAMERDSEIHGNRMNRVERRPRSTTAPKKQPMHNARVLEENVGNFGGFAPLTYGGEGDIMTADGCGVKKFVEGINQNEYLNLGGKKQARSEIERQMLNQSAEYGSMGGMNNFGGGMGINPNVYNPNIGMQQKPREIDFSLDGSGIKKDYVYDDSGRLVENDNNILGGINTNMMQHYDSYGGFGGFGDQMQQSTYNPDNDYMTRMMQMQMPTNSVVQENTNPTNSVNQNVQMMQMMQMMLEMMAGNMQTNGVVNDSSIESLTKMNTEIKTSMAGQLGMNPQAMLNMDPDEIKRLVQEKINSRHNNKSDNSSDSDSDTYIPKNKKINIDDMSKKEKLDLLLKIKKENLQTEANLKSYVSRSGHDIDSDQDSEQITQKKKVRIVVESDKEEPSKKSFRKHIVDSSEDNDSDDRKTSKKISNPETHTKKGIKKTVAVSRKSVAKTLNVNSDDVVGPEHYSDYMVDCEFTNVMEINLKNIDVPVVPKIDDNCNSFTVGNELMALEEGSYTIEEILEAFNEHLESVDSNIVISLKSTGKIVVENTKGNNFIIDCSEDTIGRHLGFTKKVYEGRSKYVSELTHAFINKPFYLYITNISPDKPFAIINPDGSFEQQPPTFSIVISKLTCLIFQFKNEMSKNGDNLVNFAGSPNKMEFEIKVSE